METRAIKSVLKKQTVAIMILIAMLCSFIPIGVYASEAVPSAQAETAAVQKPEASVKPGMYRGVQQVALTAESGARIYYTTNNLMPTVNDTEYTQPITVSEDTNICAIAVKDGAESAPVTFGYFIRTSEMPQMQFVVMSDIEIGEGLDVAGGSENVYQIDKARSFKAMEVVSGIFSNPNLLVMNGDILKQNDGKPDKAPDHTTFIKLMQDAMNAVGFSDTSVQVTIGNHDALNHSVSTMKQYYTGDAAEWFPTSTGYYHKKQSGFDFIYLNGNDNGTAQINWLTSEMAAIQEEQTAEGMVKPIFLFIHIPLKGTLDYDGYTGNEGIKNVLKNYPQAIVFSGHTHVPIAKDDSISQEAGFTAVNEGAMNYSWVPKSDTVMHRADGSVQATNEFPVAQCVAVEVYNDRVEINRVAVNADSGDAKANNYVPIEPYHNCGAVAGDTWVIPRGATTAEWKENFKYEKAQRRENAQIPRFAEDAKPVLSGTGRTATVSFPQAEEARKADKYRIELVNESTGKTDQSMNVWSENVFSPMPANLTYDVSGLASGATYRAKVTAYNDYGMVSEPIISAETFTTAELPGRKPTMLADEDFSDPLTEADHARTVIPYVENYTSGGIMGTGTMEISSGENGTAKWISNNLGGTNLMIPFGPGTKVEAKEDGTKKYIPQTVLGEFMFEFDIKPLSAALGQGDIAFYLRNGSANVAKLTIGKSNTIKCEYYTTKTALSVYASGTGKNNAHKIRLLLGTKDGKQYIGGLWIDGGKIKQEKQEIPYSPSADGWKVMAAEPASKWVTGDMCSVDNIKVWRPAAVQMNELIAAGEDNITFEQIKGTNAAAGNVTENLNLQDLVGTQTKNGLMILGWKSDNTAVIAEDGTVTRPAFQGNAANVTLTPLLGMVDTMNETGEDYVTASGTPIEVTVPDLGREPLEVAQTGYIVNEDFTETLTDTNEDHAKTVIPYIYNYNSGGIMGEGNIDLTSGAAQWIAGNTGGHNMLIPFRPGTTVDENGSHTSKGLLGEFMFEFEVTFLGKVAGKGITFYPRSINETANNAAKLNLTPSSVTYNYYYYDDSQKKAVPGTYASYTAITNSNTHKIKLRLGTNEEGKQYLSGLWVDGKEITAKTQVISDYSGQDGWKVIAASPNTANWETGDHCAIDNIKVWRSEEDQAKEMASAEDGKITFEQIKGQNDSAENVTEDLELKSGETGALQTANKMLVMGWKSDKPEIIGTDGTVTRPAVNDVIVNLTPILAIQSSDTGKYVTADGAPIQVTVKQRRQTGFFDEDFNFITVLNPSITQGIADISGLSGNIRVYAVLYSGGCLEQAWVSEKVTAGGEVTTADVTVQLPADLTGKSLKLFVWNVDTLEPLSVPIEVK